jgi:hypothetical protein
MRPSQAMLPFVLVLSGWSALGQQKTQFTPVPPKPTCRPFLTSGACADLWSNYNQAFAQRQREEAQSYVDRQKDLAAQAATAPLQQQIDDLNKLIIDQQGQIGKLEHQAQLDATAALDAQSAAHEQGLRRGLALGVGATMLLLVAFYLVRKITGTFTITKKPAQEPEAP